jgi:hypothetical protein
MSDIDIEPERLERAVALLKRHHYPNAAKMLAAEAEE